MALDWDKLRIFHAVAEAGSFTHAGEELHLSQSAVSRQISALEDSIEVPLFHRHARGLILTEQGDLLYKTAHEVFAKLTMTEALLRESKERPSGDLRVTATVALGSTWLAPLMSEFAQHYPEIELHLILDDRELDLSMRQADVAIRLNPPRQQDLIQRSLFKVHTHLYASANYLSQHGLPHTVEDLDNHRLIVFGDDSHPPVPGLDWVLTAGMPKGQKRKPGMIVNNITSQKKIIEADGGLAALPDYVADGTDLVRVLPDAEGPVITAYFVYPEEMRSTKRIKVLRDFLVKKIANSAFDRNS